MNYTVVRGKWGFNILLKDLSKCRLEEQGIEILTFWLDGNMSHSRAKQLSTLTTNPQLPTGRVTELSFCWNVF